MIASRSAVAAVLLGLVAFLSVGCGDDAEVPSEIAEGEPAVLARLAVAADSSADRSFFFTDKAGAYYYDALSGEQTDPAMGFIAGGFRLVDGWRWWLDADSVGVGPSEITGGVVRPDYAARTYVQADSAGFFETLLRRIQGDDLATLTETITLADGALLVEVADSVGTVELTPTFSDRRAASDYTVQAQGDVLLVARANYTEPRADSRRPVWLAVASTDGTAATTAAQLEDGLGVRERGLGLGLVRFATPGAVAFASGNTPEAAAAAAQQALGRRASLLTQRQQRLASVLDGSTIRTEDEAFNRAFDWARLSLEALVEEDSTGFTLVSGIPGTDLARGRSTLTAFEGAFLATGDWERARQLLTRFGRSQRRDRRIDLFGRIPNEFVDGRPVYTTVDATPVWVAAVGDYLRATGDRGIITDNGAEFWTRTVYAVRGLDDIRTPDGFLRNAAGQTWVQPYDGRGRVPRVNRAAEVQGRYYRAFRAMQPVARVMGQISGRPTSAAAYGDSARVLQQRFERAFVREDRIADVLRPNDQPDPRMRPSALFALRDFDLDADTERRILQRTAGTLAYPYGVSTLPQTDSLFYPYLNAPDFYEPGAARYDGTIWTWLSGPLVSLLVEEGAGAQAYEQTEALQRYILDRGVVGAVAENVDAHPPQPGDDDDVAAESALGGSPVQPWTLAEFVRNAYQDYAGIRYSGGNTVVLEPHLPEAWGTTEARFRLGGGSVVARIAQSASELTVGLKPSGRLPRGATVRVRAFGQVKVVPVAEARGDTLVVPLDSVSVTISADGVTLDGETVAADSSYAVADAAAWDGFAWATPEIPDEYPVMREVKRARSLDAPQISRTNPLAIPTLSRTDPDGDDWGTTATYTYPGLFPDGVLDISYVEISEDDSTTYFRVELANVVSESELGYQPALLALAFDTEEDGKVDAGRGSSYTFRKAGGFEYIVFVGNGLRIEDAQGRVLGEFEGVGDALFSVEDSAVTFSLPKFVLPDLARGTNVTVFTGARAEGSGVGEFREVRERGDSNIGGGKINPGDPNVYDVLNARVER
ncbi:MAG: amylo-alpha-1,6-glucosidase [Rhodothermales bacterium]